LTIEALEARKLLSADGFDSLSLASPIAASEHATPIFASQARNIVTTSDAGSTPGTAADVGSIDGTRRFPGTLGWNDYVDAIRFTADRNADVRIDLTELNRNANLFLVDSAGKLLGRSTLPGSSNESITAALDAGDYFIIVTGTSFLSTSYQLSITAELQDEVNLSDRNAMSPPTVLPGTSTPVTNNIQPLTEVAYFGGSREWNINAIGAPEAWAAGYSGQGVTVAVIDTGVDLDHPDLVNNLFVNHGEIPGNGIDDDGNGFVDDVHGYDFADVDANPDDVTGHGTHVAGIIAASRNGFGATGVAPNATILPVRVLGSNGTGSTNAVAAGIRYAAEMGADIINLSLGGGYSRAIDVAIDYAHSLGSLIVAAAGNESAAVPSFPARFSATDSNVISVGATSSSGALAGFSNDVGGSGAIQVDAPGVGIFSTYVGGGFATLSGTSMASPHVAGLAALMLSSNPSLTSPELRALLATGTIGRASGSDAIGSVNATTSVAYAAAGLSSSSPSSITINRTGGSTIEKRSIRATEAVAVTPALIRSTALEDLKDTRTRQELTPERFVGDRKQLDFAVSPQGTEQRYRAFDDWFREYQPSKFDSIEDSDFDVAIEALQWDTPLTKV
jgi:subtilisin family serine protease